MTLPLAAWPMGFDVLVLPKLALLRFLIVVLAGLRVASWATFRRRALREGTALDLPLVAVVASAALSTLLAVNPNLAFFGAYGRYEGMTTIASYALLFWLATGVLDRDEARNLLSALLLGGYIVGLIAIFQSLIAGTLVASSAGETARTLGGAFRAGSTLGNAGELGNFEAMLLPLAVDRLLHSQSFIDRLIILNLTVVLGLALVLTYSRSAWVGALLGTLVIVARPASRWWRRRPLLVSLGAAVGVGLGILALASNVLPPWMEAAITRAGSILDPIHGSGVTRLHIWQDTLSVIAARPWAGWGPDCFGLAYTRFQTGDWAPGFTIDKAPSDLLQVTSTQGLLGLGGHLWLLVAIATAWWHGRAQVGALPLLAAVLAYQVPLQVNFSWLPSASPYWLLLAAAVTVWGSALPRAVQGAGSRIRCESAGRPVVRTFAGGLLGVMLVGATIKLVAFPLAADQEFRASLEADARSDRPTALTLLDTSRRLAPEQGVFAAKAGDLLLDFDAQGRIGPRANRSAARQAYLDALRLGNADPQVRAHIALAGSAPQANWSPKG